MSTAPQITLRESNVDDAEFAYKVVKETMRDYAIQTWGVWLDKESKQAAIKETESGDVKIIELENDRIGILLVERSNNQIVIEQIYILPEYQNQGIGTTIISGLKKESLKLHIPLKLSVLRVNPAKDFYIRNGFIIEKETDERIYMQYEP